jgi:hypothetical protein
MGLTSLVLLLIPSFGVALAADVIDVWTKESYEPGDKVKVEGYTNVTGTVTVVITNSTGDDIFSLPVDSDEEGEFSVDFPLGEDASEGTYEVNATVGNIYNTTNFEVVAEPEDGGEDEGDNVQSGGDDPNEETMTREDLLSAIERALRFIEKVNATATTLEEEEYDMALFWEKLNGLNESLMELYKTCVALSPEDSVLVEAVEDFHDIRKEISQLNGLLNSITKNVKVTKARQFTERMMRRIGDLEGMIDGLGESAGVDEFRSSLEAHQRKLSRLWLTLNSTIPHDELEGILKDLEGVTQDVDSGLDGLGEEGLSLKEMCKLQARIEVFNATVERMKERGKTMNRLQEKLNNADQQLNDAEQLMMQMQAEFTAKNWGKMKATIGDTNENLRGIGKTIRELNKSNKGGNGKSNGNK